MYRNQYAPPTDYAIPNPLGPRIHNWRGGTLNEGSLYHGPVYTRPDYRLPWIMRPLRGLGVDPLRDGKILIFSAAVALIYPDLEQRFTAEAARRREKEGDEATQARLASCIDKQFTEADLPATPPLTPEEAAQLFPRAKVESVLSCFEGTKLGVVLPLVAGGALIIWLFTRKS